ncbi:MAG: site-specific integrase [Bacteroidota bacterium]
MKLHLLAWKTYKDGTHPIAIQIVHDRKRQIIATGYSAKPNQWNDNDKEVRANYPNSARVNTFLTKKLAAAKAILLEFQTAGRPFTLEQVVNKVRDIKPSTTVFEYTDAVIAQLESEGHIGNSRVYKAVLGVFKKYRKGRDLEFTDLDVKLLLAFQSYLVQGGAKPNTVSNYIRTLRAIYNRAMKEGFVSEEQYPFKKVRVNTVKTIKRAVSKEQIDAIRDLAIPQYSQMALVRDVFMFSFYTRGMNLVDVVYLKVSDIIGDRITYTRKKTKQHFSIKRTEKIDNIIHRYNDLSNPDAFIFPIVKRTGYEGYLDYLNFKRLVNRKLEVIGKEVGIQIPLTTYVARHSWATIAKRSGIATAIISEGLGHETEETTQIYLDSFENDVLDKANEIITG